MKMMHENEEAQLLATREDLAETRLGEIRTGAIIGLARRRRNRLDVDPHMVHVGDALLGRVALRPRPLAILAVDRPAPLARLRFEIPARDLLAAFDQGGRLVAADMAVDVSGKPFA